MTQIAKEMIDGSNQKQEGAGLDVKTGREVNEWLNMHDQRNLVDGTGWKQRELTLYMYTGN